MITKTFKEAQYLKRMLVIGIINAGINDRLNYAATKLSKNIEKACESLNDEIAERVEELQVKFALTDIESGAMLTETTQQGEKYRYSAEGRLKLNEGIKALNKEFESKEVSFQPYLIADATPRLEKFSVDFLEELSGILIPEELVQSKLAALV
jgi:uncharacterized membrane-anchored protein YhcB (DUF1043 family)